MIAPDKYGCPNCEGDQAANVDQIAALTARVAELEAALKFIQSQAYLGIGEQQPDADQFFRMIEETCRHRLTRVDTLTRLAEVVTAHAAKKVKV